MDAKRFRRRGEYFKISGEHFRCLSIADVCRLTSQIQACWQQFAKCNLSLKNRIGNFYPKPSVFWFRALHDTLDFLACRDVGYSVVSCVLIVDDNPVVRQVIRNLLTAAGVEICAEAGDGIEALEEAAAVNPTLVILDLAMPRLGGLEVAKRLRILRPYPPVILHTLHADFFRSQPLPAGVDLVIAKGEPLVPSVMAILAAS